MSKNLVYIGIAALAILAILLGYQIYQQQTGIGSQTLPTPNPVVQNNSTSPLNSTQPQATRSSTIDQYIDLDSVFKQFPGPNATEEEKIRFNDYLLSIGKEGDTLTISNCKPIPVVFRVRKGTEFSLSNLDNMDHTLNVSQVTFSVKARETKRVKTDNLDGANGYYCDGVGSKIGILHIVQ